MGSTGRIGVSPEEWNSRRTKPGSEYPKGRPQAGTPYGLNSSHKGGGQIRTQEAVILTPDAAQPDPTRARRCLDFRHRMSAGLLVTTNPPHVRGSLSVSPPGQPRTALPHGRTPAP